MAGASHYDYKDQRLYAVHLMLTRPNENHRGLWNTIDEDTTDELAVTEIEYVNEKTIIATTLFDQKVEVTFQDDTSVRHVLIDFLLENKKDYSFHEPFLFLSWEKRKENWEKLLTQINDEDRAIYIPTESTLSIPQSERLRLITQYKNLTFNWMNDLHSYRFDAIYYTPIHNTYWMPAVKKTSTKHVNASPSSYLYYSIERGEYDKHNTALMKYRDDTVIKGLIQDYHNNNTNTYISYKIGSNALTPKQKPSKYISTANRENFRIVNMFLEGESPTPPKYVFSPPGSPPTSTPSTKSKKGNPFSTSLTAL